MEFPFQGRVGLFENVHIFVAGKELKGVCLKHIQMNKSQRLLQLVLPVCAVHTHMTVTVIACVATNRSTSRLERRDVRSECVFCDRMEEKVGHDHEQ